MSGQGGDRDELGMVTWTVPYYVEDPIDIFAVGKTPPLDGLKEVGRSWSDIEGAGIQVDVTFEGYSSESGEGGSTNPEDEEPQYEFDASFKEETLVAHPDWQNIKDFYEGTYDKETKQVKFNEFLSLKASGGGFVIQEDGSKRGLANPLFGVETFLNLSVIFRETRLYSSIPENILESIGTIDQTIPGGFPTPPDRDWLIMPPRIRQSGEVFRVSREWLLSPAKGWPSKVYDYITI